jgi:hypothetical protein
MEAILRQRLGMAMRTDSLEASYVEEDAVGGGGRRRREGGFGVMMAGFGRQLAEGREG